MVEVHVKNPNGGTTMIRSIKPAARIATVSQTERTVASAGKVVVLTKRQPVPVSPGAYDMALPFEHPNRGTNGKRYK